MGFMGVANPRYLLEELEKRKKFQEMDEKLPKVSYKDFHEKLNSIPMINQLKNNYHDNRDSGYSCETSFQWAKVKTLEEYLEFILDTIEKKNLKNLYLSSQLKEGFDLIKNEPLFLTQFLEDSYVLKENNLKI